MLEKNNKQGQKVLMLFLPINRISVITDRNYVQSDNSNVSSIFAQKKYTRSKGYIYRLTPK